METAKSDTDEARAYLAAMRQAIKNISVYPRERQMFDLVTFGLLSKVFSLADAVIVLVENQHPQEGFGLVRTLVECTLNLRYLTRERPEYETRADRFSKFFFAERGKWLCAMLEYYRDDPVMIAKLKVNAQKRSITPRPERLGHWSGEDKFSTYKVAVTDHPLDGALNTLKERKADYESGYFRTSPYVHGSVDAVKSFYPDNNIFVPRLTSDGPQGRVACIMVVRFVHQAARYTLYGAGIQETEAIETIFREIWARLGR